jgi:hypothetical protein
MTLFLRAFVFFAFIICCFSANGASLFHSYITDLSPPYFCKLKLKAAKGVGLENKHSYQFSGICSVKVPIGNVWIYQNVWVDLLADWNGETNEGFETTMLHNDLGTVAVQLKCDNDPWLSKAQCALVGYQNNTQFTNFGGVFNARTGQYPPYDISRGQYPPLARNQAILQEAIVLSILAARQEANAAHAQFNQTFQNQLPAPTHLAETTKRRMHQSSTRIFRNPKIGNIRLDCCVRMNKECGKPAADRFCQSMGYQQSVKCKIDKTRGMPTIFIGTLTTCKQPFCRSFAEIECAK